jgi:hypothetical protein
MEIIKSPQDNIEAFLCNEVNIEIFNTFETLTYDGKPESLEFFNLLFSELDFFNVNIANYFKIKEHFTPPTWEELENGGIENLNKTEFYYGFVKLISACYPKENLDGVIKKSCEHIEKIYRVLIENFYGDIKSHDTFKQLQQDYKGLNHSEQIKNWIDIKYTVRQDIERHIYDKDEAEIFIQKIDFELERLDTIKDLETNKATTSTEQSNYNTLNWQGTSLEFAELTKALIESGFIGKVKNEKEAFEKMKLFFNVPDFDKSDKLKQVRKRTKELTPVINTLETSLLNWIKRKD